jgi:hydroxymethylbilane synthase
MTNKVIQIGSSDEESTLGQASYLKNELFEKYALNASICILSNTSSKEAESALVNNEVDVVVQLMENLSLAHTENLCLAALSIRADCRDLLVIRNEVLSPDEDLMLKKNASIGTASARRMAQVGDLRPDLSVKEFQGKAISIFEELKSGSYDAVIVSKADFINSGFHANDTTVIELHPAEFVPAPGQGVYAYQCRKDDLALRKTLLQLHNADVAECTNVERKVLMLMNMENNNTLGVHCIKDKNANFHAYAAYTPDLAQPLVRVRKSQSTVFNLAELVASTLLKYKP